MMERILELEKALRESHAREKELREEHTMQLVAIMTATFQNTESTIKDRIEKGNTYWTVAYSDVCRAIDREMERRSERDTLTQQLSAAREALQHVKEFYEGGDINSTECRCYKDPEGHCPYCSMITREVKVVDKALLSLATPPHHKREEEG